MAVVFSPIIEATELLKLFQTEEIILIAVCTEPNAFINYQEKHLSNALFFDLNTQLSDIKSDVAIGGRHPLPSVEQFSKLLESSGISKNSHVVIYDNKNGANAAARLWWMLKAVGHKKVQVLNGGFQAAEKIGFPIKKEIELPTKKSVYKIEKWQLPLADINEVEAIMNDSNYLIIDVRESYRYQGIEEPIDLIAGHIPGAINIPFETNLDENGLFLSPEKLKFNYQKIFKNVSSKNSVVHCGSGVTACHTLLAIDYAGLEMPKLYVGSWSEWSRNKNIDT